MPFAATWLDLEIILLTEDRQRQTYMIYDIMVSFICGIQLIKKKKKTYLQKQTYRYQKQNYGYQRANVVGGGINQ